MLSDATAYLVEKNLWVENMLPTIAVWKPIVIWLIQDARFVMNGSERQSQSLSYLMHKKYSFQSKTLRLDTVKSSFRE